MTNSKKPSAFADIGITDEAFVAAGMEWAKRMGDEALVEWQAHHGLIPREVHEVALFGATGGATYAFRTLSAIGALWYPPFLLHLGFAIPEQYMPADLRAPDGPPQD
ncbi:MAG TPA: hypothetical protein VK735_39970 [Pseudonocardia sp.]|uniref:hypothetical protein n=1 Tax=Pseudonocardia sp. TaxID=60912 RepID=UPI002C469DD2|nr:hypothetical protein [Pseudonocardia sp.]HTF53662.1 hypothetical protein [Pseudonocardia sp.]